MIRRTLLSAALAAGLAPSAHAQAIRTTPYNAQLRTDPAVGNVQGIQRYGRPLATDPDQGEGYSYHVYPTTSDNTVVVATGGQAAGAPVAGGVPGSPLAPLAPLAPLPALIAGGPYGGPIDPYPPPYNPTAGRRLVSATQVTGGTTGTPAPTDVVPAPLAMLPEAVHQPLIQVKVRVVEIDRSKSLFVSSVLDFVRGPFSGSTLIMGNNINHNTRDLSGGTRFAIPDDLITFADKASGISTLTGSGALVNLTTGNLNYIARLLQNEFHSDIVTAPEVITLNGQNVEFIAGQKVPFALGQNVIQGTNNNIQQFFYKHVGTYISVTPQIVNWKTGYASGGGRAAVIESDVVSWRGVLKKFAENQPLLIGKDDVLDAYLSSFAAWEDSLLQDARKEYVNARLSEWKKAGKEEKLFPKDQIMATQPKDMYPEIRQKYYEPEPPVPAVIKEKILAALNQSRTRGVDRLFACCISNIDSQKCNSSNGCGPGCDWRPEDCTIDLNVIIRLSGLTDTTIGVNPTSNVPVSIKVPVEDNVRAIADIVQVKSGHGVVMGGLIGDQEVKDVDKVPVLGDIPYLGALFRSTATTRHKTEVVVFIEAKVLDPNPTMAHGQSAEDFALSQPFVTGAFLDNPLEFGMHRAGFGTYLPPHSREEKVFWERLGRKCRDMCTTLDDIFE
jgi:Bacterial type II and III secretion system protein